MPKKPPQHSRLIANREEQSRVARRARDEAFGIYRPLTPISKQAVRVVLHGGSVRDAQDGTFSSFEGLIARTTTYLGHRMAQPAEFTAARNLGTTFVHRRHIQHGLRYRAFSRGFELSRFVNDVKDEFSAEYQPLEVPIEDFDWFGRRVNGSFLGRKFVARFARSSRAYMLLQEQGIQIAAALEAAELKDIRVFKADHVTIAEYGKPNDGHDISVQHSRDIRNIATETFHDAGVRTLALGQLVVGRTYDQSIIAVRTV